MSIREQALSRVAGWNDEQTERTSAQRLLTSLRETRWNVIFTEAAARAEDLIHNGNDLDEIRAAIAAREAARPDFLAYNEIDSFAVTRAKIPLTTVTTRSPEDLAPAFEYLNGEMSDLLLKVRSLDRKLGRVRTIEDAIRDDKLAKKWRELEDAADRYEQIRDAQETICKQTSMDRQHLTARLNTVGRLRNAFDLDIHWIARRAPRVNVERTEYNRDYLEWYENPPRPAWQWDASRGTLPVWPDLPHSMLDSRPPQPADRTDVLRWLAKNNAAWVPTLEQMEAAAANIDAMESPLQTLAQIRHALTGFHRYYTERGVTPVHPFDGHAALKALPAPRGLHDHRDAHGRTHPDPRIVALTGR